MRPLIEKGYLYIAQPPLFKGKRGQQEVYLKDNNALQNYLLSNSLEGAFLNINGSKSISGEELKQLTDKVVNFNTALHNFRRLPPQIAQIAALAGMFSTNNSKEQLREMAKWAEIKLESSHLLTSGKKNWIVECTTAGEITFTQDVRGVNERIILDQSLITTNEAMELHQLAKELEDIFTANPILSRKAVEQVIYTPTQYYDTLIEIGKKGTYIQRFKGLGEMNPEQLWETTLDPEKRTLLQVKVRHEDEAEEVFSTLMGSVVEPRRDFIQENALKAVNLDV
jgi:DNA gyrase subunit B